MTCRRWVLKSIGSAIVSASWIHEAKAEASETGQQPGKVGAVHPSAADIREQWIENALTTKSLADPLRLGRFVEPVYFLTSSTSWQADVDVGSFKAGDRVTVPQGFVTDLASIPQIFFSALRPDGEYAHAAIVHDYLYWFQPVDRSVADRVLKSAMEDLEVSPATVALIYNAVSAFGKSAWDANAAARAAGESRILKIFPSNGTTRWSDWKKNSGNLT